MIPEQPLTLGDPAAAIAAESTSGEAEWAETRESLRFTFAGLFFHAVEFRCRTLRRPLGMPPYPIDFASCALPDGVPALRLCAQPITTRLPRLRRFGGGIRYVPLQGRRHYVDLESSFDAYFGKFNRKSRATIRRKLRRFTETSEGILCWKEYESVADMREFYALATKISKKTYQHRFLRAGFDSSREALDRLIANAQAGRIQAYLLFHRQQPVSYLLCHVNGRDLVVDKMGFDPDFATYSPGMILFYLVLEKLFETKRFGRLDLGEGDFTYKAHMATDSIEVAEVYWFRCNPRNIVLVGSHSVIGAISDSIRFCFRRLNLEKTAKRLIRRRLAGFLRRRRHGAQAVR